MGGANKERAKKDLSSALCAHDQIVGLLASFSNNIAQDPSSGVQTPPHQSSKQAINNPCWFINQPGPASRPK